MGSGQQLPFRMPPVGLTFLELHGRASVLWLPAELRSKARNSVEQQVNASLGSITLAQDVGLRASEGPGNQGSQQHLHF